MSDYYDRSGKPISSETYASLHRLDVEGKPYMRIAETSTEGCRVSTVWLGSNHQYGDGPPVIFETMVFGGGLDQFAERWSTEEEARAGHDAMVERVRHEADVFRSIVDDPAVRAAAIALRDTRKAYREVVGGYELDEKDYGRIINAIEASEVDQ
jgi:hypothetical protein